MAGGSEMQVRGQKAANLQGLMLDGRVEKAQVGALNARRVEVAQAQPRAQNILERAWSAISGFVKSVAGWLSRAEPAAAQPRAEGDVVQQGETAPLGHSSAADASSAAGDSRLSVSTHGQLVGEAAQRFEQLATSVSKRQLSLHADGICEQAATDWKRATPMVIGGQESAYDVNRSIDLLRQLTGGNDEMVLRISQFANQNPVAGIHETLRAGSCGNTVLYPIAFKQDARIQIDPQPDGGFHIKHDVGFAAMSHVADLSSSTGATLECDPEQSRMNFSFTIRIAPDGTASMAQTLNYSVQLRSPD